MGAQLGFVGASPYFCVCDVLLAVSVVEGGFLLGSDLGKREKYREILTNSCRSWKKSSLLSLISGFQNTYVARIAFNCQWLQILLLIANDIKMQM